MAPLWTWAGDVNAPPHHDHDHGNGEHDHGHGHSHAGHSHAGHSHVPASFGPAFFIGIALNTGFIIVEVIYGIFANSVALLADAGHNVSDVLSLAAAWIAYALANRPPTQRYTYGLKGSSVLAAMFNAVTLLVALGAIAWEAVQRLLAPEPVMGVTVTIVASIGILVNGATALLFMSGRSSDLNIRGAFLHMTADAAVSLGVVISALVILQTGWLWLDPAVSLVVAVLIFWSTWGLLRDSMALAMSAVPATIDPTAIREALQALPGVASVHDLHVWPIGTTDIAIDSPSRHAARASR